MHRSRGASDVFPGEFHITNSASGSSSPHCPGAHLKTSCRKMPISLEYSMCARSASACSQGLHDVPKRPAKLSSALSSSMSTLQNSLPRSELSSIGHVFARVAQRKKARRTSACCRCRSGSNIGAPVVTQMYVIT